MTSPVGIGEHPDIVGSIEALFGVIAEAQDKIDAIKKYEQDIVVENETTMAELKANERKRNKARVPKTG
jgi:nitrate/TMAO reductase-like tetraheme cytochrome c subunit